MRMHLPFVEVRKVCEIGESAFLCQWRWCWCWCRRFICCTCSLCVFEALPPRRTLCFEHSLLNMELAFGLILLMGWLTASYAKQQLVCHWQMSCGFAHCSLNVAESCSRIGDNHWICRVNGSHSIDSMWRMKMGSTQMKRLTRSKPNASRLLLRIEKGAVASAATSGWTLWRVFVMKNQYKCRYNTHPTAAQIWNFQYLCRCGTEFVTSTVLFWRYYTKLDVQYLICSGCYCRASIYFPLFSKWWNELWTCWGRSLSARPYVIESM